MALKEVEYTFFERSSFDNIMPWAGMKRCLLQDDGTVSYYLHPDDSRKKEDGTPAILDGTDGQVMVEIPKFYYRSFYDENDSVYRWEISSKKRTGFKIHPAFMRGLEVKDKIYIGAFEASLIDGKLCSLPYKTVKATQNIGTFRKQARARNINWGLQDFLTTSAVQLLYLVEYGNFNAQETIGQGITSDGSYHQTGETLQYGNHSYGDTNSGTMAMSYRGIENFYGNYWKLVDGILIKDNGYYIEDDLANFNDSGTGYKHIPANPTTSPSHGYISDIEPVIDYGFIGRETNGSANTHLSDLQWSHDSGEVNVCSVGGPRDYGSRAGFFCWALNLDPYQLYSYRSARLLAIF